MEPSKSLESRFSHLNNVPMDEAFTMIRDFANDKTPGRVDLGAGVYRDENERPLVLSSVKKAEQLIVNDPTGDHEYQPMSGHPEFIKGAQAMTFGSLKEELASRIASIQTISGTGACHMGFKFLAENLKPGRVWLSDPSWPNHHLIWNVAAPEVEQCLYPYYDIKTRSLDFDGMVDTLERDARKGDILLLHACAHNPTGLDPSLEQWAEIADLCQRKELFPFFDSAYQGFASGDLDRDAAAIQLFAGRGMELMVAQSLSKNFGLYGQRAGALHAVVSPGADAQVCRATQAHLVRLVRGEYSTAPIHGARIVSTILSDEGLRQEWLMELQGMSERVREMRSALYKELTRLATPGSWEHIVHQIGMFSYTGLSVSQVERLRRDHHIYLMASGRASVAGLNSRNVSAVAYAIDAVVRKDMERVVENTTGKGAMNTSSLVSSQNDLTEVVHQIARVYIRVA